VRDPFSLVQQIWNHAGSMPVTREVELSARDLADIAAFVRPEGSAQLTLPAAESGKSLFDANCGGCHPKIVPLEGRLRNRSLTEIAAGIRNHLVRMQRMPLVAPNDMRSIVAYVWQMQHLAPSGDPERGQKRFTERRCASCHVDTAGRTNLARGERIFTPFSMISLGWGHRTLPEWPSLSERDVADIVAYINTQP
jgi:mono/diheme cytochrome c family protein